MEEKPEEEYQKGQFENMDGNAEDFQPTEQDPCLPINSVETLKIVNSQTSIDKHFKQNEKELDSRINMTDVLPNSKEPNDVYVVNDKKPFVSFANSEFETKICKKFGLTHQGFIYFVTVIFLLVLLCLVILILAIIWPRTPHSQLYPVCTKAACFKSSASILPKMDTSASPCDNFYTFTCGKWSKEHSKPPATRSRWGQENELELHLAEDIRDVISTLPQPTTTSSLNWKIKYFYESCMALDVIESDTSRPLKKIINELGGWHVLREFSVHSWDSRRVLEKLHSSYGVSPFFSVDVAADPNNSTRNILVLSPSGLGLPDISYYYRPKDDQMTMSYRNYMKDQVLLLGATSIDANSFSDDMFYFEKRIAEITPNNSELRNVSKHVVVSLTELKSKAPSIPIHEILNAMLPTANIADNTEVLVTSLSYLIRVSHIISTTDRAALNDYFMWSLAKNYLHYLTADYMNNYYLYQRKLTGAAEPLERWEFCVRTLHHFTSFGLSVLIENKMPHREEKTKMIGDMFDNIRDTIRASVTKADWIELELFKHLTNKLNGMALQVGYSPPILEDTYIEDYYSTLYVQKQDFFQNILYGVSFLQKELVRRYLSPREEYQWLSKMSTENKIFLIPTSDKIVVPLRLLREPHFHHDYSPPLLYGNIGTQISTAIVSSLLPYNVLYTSRGNVLAWNDTVAKYSFYSIQHQLRCLIENTLADDEPSARRASLNTFIELSGVKEAIKAMKKLSQNQDHVHQPGLENFEDDAMFYIVFGQSLCVLQTVQESDRENTTSSSLPNKLLLQTVASHLKSFKQAFSCSSSDSMCPHIL